MYELFNNYNSEHRNSENKNSWNILLLLLKLHLRLKAYLECHR